MQFIFKLLFNIWLPKEEKRKMKVGRGKSTGPLNPLEVTSVRGGGACDNRVKCKNNGCLPLCLLLCEEKQKSMIRAQTPNMWRTRPFLPTLAPASYVQLLQEHVHSCLPWGWGRAWVAATVLRAEIN